MKKPRDYFEEFDGDERYRSVTNEHPVCFCHPWLHMNTTRPGVEALGEYMESIQAGDTLEDATAAAINSLVRFGMKREDIAGMTIADKIAPGRPKGTGTTTGKPGRPKGGTKPFEDRLFQIAIGLTMAQQFKLRMLGGPAWIREQLDNAEG